MTTENWFPGTVGTHYAGKRTKCACAFHDCANVSNSPTAFCEPCLADEDGTPECQKSLIWSRLTELGFVRVGTGGNCEAAERKLTDGFYLMVTDGEAGFPTDADDALYVGLFTEEHGEPLKDRSDVAPQDLAAVVDELKTYWLLRVTK